MWASEDGECSCVEAAGDGGHSDSGRRPFYRPRAAQNCRSCRGNEDTLLNVLHLALPAGSRLL